MAPVGSGNGNFDLFDPGVTTGGTKDMAYARQIIEDGDIPDPDAVTVEGLLSEHDIPVEEPPAAPILYSTVTTAWNQDFETILPLATVAVGLGTTINAGEFTRQPQNLCLVIDRSGSMNDAIDARTGTSKLAAVKIAVDRLLANLTDNDRVSIVSFNDAARVDLSPTSGTNVAAIKDALDQIDADGSTNLHNGLARGYRLLDEHPAAGTLDRLLVFTDALPTYGPGSTEAFLDLMEDYAAEDIGATVFGVGLDFGEELAQDIAQVRGGNFFYLNDFDRIVSVFDEEFDYLVTPIAYDVELRATIEYAWDVHDVYGLPGVDELGHVLELNVPTLFFSTRQGGGAILIRLRAGSMVNFEEPAAIGTVQFSYQSAEGNVTTITNPIELPAGLSEDGSQSFFPTPASQRGVLLLNTALTLKAACTDAYLRWYWDDADYSRAAERLTEFLPYFDGLAEGLDDRTSENSRALSQERVVMEKLLANVESRMGSGGETLID